MCPHPSLSSDRRGVFSQERDKVIIAEDGDAAIWVATTTWTLKEILKRQSMSPTEWFEGAGLTTESCSIT